MLVLQSRNVNYALPRGVTELHALGIREPSRNGDVLRIPTPVTSVYERPLERVCFHPWRDANPFFHLIEAMWMLAGRDDLKPLTDLVARFRDYSDDGVVVPGAYGKRWRDWFSQDALDHSELFDQLDWVVKRLRKSENDRRTVIQMWDAAIDPDRADNGGRDVPCNLVALPWVSEGKLHLTVFCRSNDMIWGAYGANAAHFSFLLEYLAARVSLPVGQYYQVSNNFHGYVENAGDPKACWPVVWGATDPYAKGLVRPFALNAGLNRLLDDKEDREFKEDLAVFFDEGPAAVSTMGRTPFLTKVVVPMALAHRHFKTNRGEERYMGALEILAQLPEDNDWRKAAEEWVIRRFQKWQVSDNDGVSHG